MNFFKKNIWLFLLVIFCLSFFYPFLFQGKIPIPADALVGLYHPFRDSLADSYPNGYPFKNPLITDPIRQQYPYRFLAFDLIKNKQLPVWNPYSFGGTPLLSNIQSAVFYPFNFLFFLFDFNYAWSIQILLQLILAGVFIYFYLKSLKLNPPACFLGSMAFAFSGFMTAWLEWNTVGHVILWLPLILLCIDKILNKFSLKWLTVIIFSLTVSFLAGHLQTAFYVWGFSLAYLLVKLLNIVRVPHHFLSFPSRLNRDKLQRESKIPIFMGMTLKIIIFILYLIIIILIFLIILILYNQFISTVDFILLSARQFDLVNWQRPDWFIPRQHLLQFVAPDFFGNPATGNYWGVWNYGEFAGYIGLIPLVFAIYAMLARRDRKTLFFGTGFFISLFLALPTFLGKISYQLKLPFISTMQPSRIISIIDFCLVVLGALGLDYFIRQYSLNKKSAIRSLLLVCILSSLTFLIIWLFLIFSDKLFTDQIFLSNLKISQKNMILPTGLLGVLWLYVLTLPKNKNPKIFIWLTGILLLVMSFDLLRFSQKFNPFVDRSLIFPQTKTLEFMQKNLGFYRYLTTDRRILAPNISSFYKLQSIDGYDPLYLSNYAEFVASWMRQKPDITPAQFARIITPENYDSFLADLLGVKYILSLKNETSPKLKPVFQEGETRLYENLGVFPRVFLAEEIINLPDKQAVMQAMHDNKNKLHRSVFTDSEIYLKPLPLGIKEKVEIVNYSENNIIIKANTENERLLVLTDIYYPGWKVFVNNRETSIFAVDYLFRGVFLPKGESIIEFKI